MDIITFMEWPEKPKDVGDCYLLIGYPANENEATLAFAMHMDDPNDSDRWVWALIADDGDIFLWGDEIILADDIVPVRPVRSGLKEHIPEKWRESALRV